MPRVWPAGLRLPDQWRHSERHPESSAQRRRVVSSRHQRHGLPSALLGPQRAEEPLPRSLGPRAVHVPGTGDLPARSFSRAVRVRLRRREMEPQYLREHCGLADACADCHLLDHTAGRLCILFISGTGAEHWSSVDTRRLTPLRR